MNVVLISVDSLRAEYTDFSTMVQLKKEGMFFDTCISPAPLTPVSHACQLTGLNPYSHGIRHFMRDKLKAKVVTLAQMLNRAGYATGGFVSSIPVNRHFGFDRGFDTFDDDVGRERMKKFKGYTDQGGRTYSSRDAEETNRAAVGWIKQTVTAQKPLFVFVHYFDVHWPHQQVKGYDVDEERYSGETLGYASEVSYVDSQIGEIIKVLKNLGIYEETLFIVTSDHGEDLGDHGGKGSLYPQEFAHGWLLYDCTQKVPLIFKLPDSFQQANPQHSLAGQCIRRQVRLIDIVPTILDVLNLDPELRMRVEGVSLVPFMKGESDRRLVALCQNLYPRECVEELQKDVKDEYHNLEAVRWDNKWKHIYSINESGEPVDGIRELYDLVRDPKEQINLLGEGSAPFKTRKADK